ncbi:hypothetical protein D3C80_1270950 [compost metagenome]
MRCVGQGLLQGGGQAVGRDDVEASTGQDHDAGRAGCGIARLGRGHDIDLAAQVDIVAANRDAGIEHLCAGCRIGPCAMRHHADPLQCLAAGIGIVQVEGRPRQVHFSGQGLDRLRIAAGQHRPHALRLGLACNAQPGITIGTVNHPARTIGACRAVIGHGGYLRLIE